MPMCPDRHSPPGNLAPVDCLVTIDRGGASEPGRLRTPGVAGILSLTLGGPGMTQPTPNFGSMGVNVTIHPTVVLINPEKVFLGNNVRIDCFCLLSAGDDGIHIGNNVHLAAGSYLFGSGGKVVLEDFCGLSSRLAVSTASVAFAGGDLTHPTIPEKYQKVRR